MEMGAPAFSIAEEMTYDCNNNLTAGTLQRVLRLDSTSFIVVLIVVGVLAFCLFAKPHAVFVIRIRNGAPLATHGKVTDAFLSTIEELCEEQGIQSGELRGVPRGRRISLWFSRGLPNSFCQRLRNWWAISGWLAGPSRV
jgi:hypothetical protein